MKKILFLFLLLIGNLIANAQSDNWQNDPFGEWISIHNEPAGSISISFRLAPKYNICHGMAQSFYRIENTFNETVKFKIYFSYKDCDGKIQEYSDFFFYEGAKVDQALGLFFFGYKEAGVHNIRIAELKFPDREKAEQKRKEVVIEAKHKQEEDIKKTEEQKQKQQEDVSKKPQENTNQNTYNQQQYQQQQYNYQSQQDYRKQQQLEMIQRDYDEAKRRRDAANADLQKSIQESSGAIVDLLSMIGEVVKENPSYHQNSWGIGFNLGLNYTTIPIIKNNVLFDDNRNAITSHNSKTGTISTPGIVFGTDIWPFRGPHFGIGGFADFEYGPFSFTDGNNTSINILNYGGTLLMGVKKIKLVLEGSIHNRDILYGDESFDIPSSIKTTNDGKATYQLVRTGAGLMYDFGNDDNENNLCMMMLFDRPGFLPTEDPSMMVGRLQYTSKGMKLKFEYSNKYVVAGEKKFSLIDKSNQNYFYLSLAIRFAVACGNY